MVSQHAGGGKSDQYFIRGFDADHGTDIAIFADGVPVNMPSHGHGQGYADTHFLIPETIDVVDVHKGPYAARFGDFYTAGAMELKTIDKVDGADAVDRGRRAARGPRRFEQYNRRIVGMASPQLRDNDSDRSLIAVQIADTDGPFEQPAELPPGQRAREVAGQRRPRRAEARDELVRGDVERVGPGARVRGRRRPRSTGSARSIRSEGGDTSRTSGQLGYTVRDDHGGTWRASAFVVEYRLRLFSNFTLFARDPVHGDEIEQNDARIDLAALDTAYDARFDLGDMDTLAHGRRAAAQRRRRQRRCGTPSSACGSTTASTRLRTRATTRRSDPRRRRVRRGERSTCCRDVHVLPGLRFEQLHVGRRRSRPGDRDRSDGDDRRHRGRAIVMPEALGRGRRRRRSSTCSRTPAAAFTRTTRAATVASDGDGALARALGAEAGVRIDADPARAVLGGLLVPAPRLGAGVERRRRRHRGRRIRRGATASTSRASYDADCRGCALDANVEHRALDARRERRQRQRARARAEADGAGRRHARRRARSSSRCARAASAIARATTTAR